MNTPNKQYIKEYVRNSLKRAMSDDYTSRICDAIIDDVVSDVEACADKNFNEDDIRLAIGRVLCDRLSIEY